jgi:thioredoxin reductase
VNTDVFDLTIIGGGPTGLFAAYYSGLRRMKTKIIDALPELGGQLTALYPEKYVYDVAGFPKILAKDLAKNLIEQALQYGPSINLGEKVVRMDIIEKLDRIIRLTTVEGREHVTKALLLTVGIGAFSPRKLSLPDVEKFEGNGVFYFVPEKSVFKDRDILIVGGGNSAVDWALNLEGYARQVTLIHRRDQFRAHEDSVRNLLNSSVNVKLFYELHAIRGNNKVEGAVIYQNRTKVEETLSVDCILLNLGFVASLGAITEWGIEIEKNDIKVNSRMETNIPGIYAAGDIVTYPGKLKLIATGFGEAAVAVNAAKAFIDPTAKYFPGHSSDMEPPPSAKS